VPVVVSDFPGMRAIAMDDPAGPLGAVCQPDDPASIGAALRSLLALDPAARADLRLRCLAAARERWNWETESARLLDVYRAIGPAAPGAAPLIESSVSRIVATR
jgi:glycosyltransferase involved in cell wall biosynthesis